MSSLPRVAIVAPTHNSLAQSVRFLEAASALTYPGVDVVLVDDGSTDGTAEVVAERFPGVTVLRGDGTLWWSGSTNLGVEWARAHGADYVLVINSDTGVDPAVVTRLVETAEANPRSLVGAMVLSAQDPDDVWFFGARLDLQAADLRHVRGRPSDFGRVEEAEVLFGMGSLIPVAVFDEIGLFDAKRFPQYFGDTDFALRARYAGFRLLVDPTAVVYCDIESSWIARARREPTLAYPFMLLFSRRSPESILYRRRFYALHWPKRRYRALAHYYGSLVKNELLRSFLPRFAAKVRRRLWRSEE